MIYIFKPFLLVTLFCFYLLYSERLSSTQIGLDIQESLKSSIIPIKKIGTDNVSILQHIQGKTVLRNYATALLCDKLLINKVKSFCNSQDMELAKYSNGVINFLKKEGVL